MPRRRAGQQQIRHIRTGDQQHDSDHNQQRRAGEQHRAGAGAAGEKDFAKRPDGRGVNLGGGRIGSRKGRCQGGDVGPCLRPCDVRLEPADAEKGRLAAVGQHILHRVRKHALRHRRRHPEIGTEDGGNADEMRGSDTDHGHGDIVDLQLAAHDVLRSAEALLPRGIVENRDRVGARSGVLLGSEEASPRRTDA